MNTSKMMMHIFQACSYRRRASGKMELVDVCKAAGRELSHMLVEIGSAIVYTGKADC